MRWIAVAALVLLACAMSYGAYIENVASATYVESGEEVAVESNPARTDILEPHTVDVTATVVPIP